MVVTKEIILQKLKDKDQILTANQNNISIPIVKRICNKMKLKLVFPPICVCNNNIIIDGHHRYLSSILADFPLEIVKNYPKPSIMNETQWNFVEYTDDDWDSISKIQMLNEKDANYNGMRIEELQALMGKMA